MQENVPSRFVSSSHVPRIGTVSSPARNAANAAAVSGELALRPYAARLALSSAAFGSVSTDLSGRAAL